MRKLSLTALSLVVTAALQAQQGPVLSSDDYARAESMLGYNTESLVDHGSVRPNWLAGDR